MDFTDLSSLGTLSPYNSSESTKSSSKKRGINATGRLRLLPLDAGGGGGNYEVNNNNNNNNSNNNSGSVSSRMMLPGGFGKLKKITQKKELLEAVRKANSPIILPARESLGGAAASGALRHESTSSLLADNNDSSVSSAARDIECLEDGVRAYARKFNDHKMLADRRQRELSLLMDELRALQLETHELSRLQNQDTPVARQSQRIRDEIQDCTASMEQQMHVRRQLEHMARRLQTGQLKIDAHLGAMAKTVDASLREADEVKLLCRQLEAGKSRAIQFLQDVQLQLQLDRKTRARELTDTEIRAKNAQKMEAWRLQRIQERAEMAAQLRGDLSADEELRLLRCIESRERANELLHVANKAKSQRAADYDAVLAQLKLAMGATSLHEVVEKIHAQTVTGVSLDKEKALAETKLTLVRQEKEHAVQCLNELKASGIGGMELNREVYNTLEQEIQQARATLKVNKAAYERLDGVVQAVRQGSFGLTQRLQAFDGVLDVSSVELVESVGSGVLLSTQRMDNADCLALAEVKLTKMVELLGQQSNASSSFSSSGGSGGAFGAGTDGDDGGFGEDGGDDGGTSRGVDFSDERYALWSPTCNSDPVLHRNNIRVGPGRYAVVGNHVVDRGEEDEDARRRQQDNALALDSARSDRSTASDSGGAGGDFMDVHVPSRDILKMSSSRHFAEVLRKREMAEKQKAAAERGISDEEMLSKLRKKNQLDADARLATSPHKDALKSYAFVTQLHFNDL